MSGKRLQLHLHTRTRCAHVVLPICLYLYVIFRSVSARPVRTPLRTRGARIAPGMLRPSASFARAGGKPPAASLPVSSFLVAASVRRSAWLDDGESMCYLIP
jgi:hypothetical protein